jgi:hypothetical protein
MILRTISTHKIDTPSILMSSRNPGVDVVEKDLNIGLNLSSIFFNKPDNSYYCCWDAEND